MGKGRIADSFCQMKDGELFVINMNIDQWDHATYFNHAAKRERKLLLTRTELRRLERSTKEKGLSIVPLRLFITETGLAKLEIALARGKKLYDKRESIRKKTCAATWTALWRVNLPLCHEREAESRIHS